MTDAIRQIDDTAPSAREIRCPVCSSRHHGDFFELHGVPVDTCRLWDAAEQAKQARLGDVVLSYCRSCGFGFNRIYDGSKVSFQPGYEASLVYSNVFTTFQHGVATRLIDRYGLRNKTIVEIGCGRGEFLTLLCELGGNNCIGFDPTLPGESIEQIGRGSVQLVPDYYTAQRADLEPDFICCLSVLEDMPQPVAFLEDLKRILGTRRPAMYFEIFNAFRAFEQNETWSIHYEQCNYFGLDSFTYLFERAGFEVLEAGTCYEGDQYLFAEVMPTPETETPSSQVANLRPIPSVITAFADHHAESMALWQRHLNEFARTKTKAVVWGSGGKGTSFLNALDNTDAIRYVVDINPNRQGQYIGGSGHQIVAPEFLQQYQPDIIVITNPLYEREITEQVAALGIACEFMTI